MTDDGAPLPTVEYVAGRDRPRASITSPRVRRELWADTGQVELAISPCGLSRDADGRPVEPRWALSVLTAEGNLAFFGTASELGRLAERFADLARQADPARPGEGTCALCDREDEAY